MSLLPEELLSRQAESESAWKNVGAPFHTYHLIAITNQDDCSRLFHRKKIPYFEELLPTMGMHRFLSRLRSRELKKQFFNFLKKESNIKAFITCTVFHGP